MIRTPNHLLTLVSSPKHIKELEDAPNDCLSLAAASKEVGILEAAKEQAKMGNHSCFSRNTQCTDLNGLIEEVLTASDSCELCGVF